MPEEDGTPRSTRWIERYPGGPGGPRCLRVSGTRPTRHPASRRSNARVLPPRRANERDLAQPTPTGRGSGDRRAERLSRRSADSSQGSGELPNSLDLLGGGIPLRSEDLPWRTAIELRSLTVEPSPYTECVVRPLKVGEHQGKPMDPGRQRIRPGAGARQVAPEAHRRRTSQRGELIATEDTKQLRYLAVGERRLGEGVVESLDQPCETVCPRIALEECDSRVASDPGRGSLARDPPNKLKIQSIYPLLIGQQPQSQRSAQQPNRRSDKRRTVQRRLYGRYSDGSHLPKSNRTARDVKAWVCRSRPDQARRWPAGRTLVR